MTQLNEAQVEAKLPALRVFNFLSGHCLVLLWSGKQLSR